MAFHWRICLAGEGEIQHNYTCLLTYCSPTSFFNVESKAFTEQWRLPKVCPRSGGALLSIKVTSPIHMPLNGQPHQTDFALKSTRFTTFSKHINVRVVAVSVCICPYGHLYTIPPISTHNLYHAEWPPLYNSTYINPQPISCRMATFIQSHSLYQPTTYIIQIILHTTSQPISYKLATFIPHSLYHTKCPPLYNLTAYIIQSVHLHTTSQPIHTNWLPVYNLTAYSYRLTTFIQPT